MINFSKKFLFILLILSFGLVLSACNKSQETGNDGETIYESSQQENQEVILNEEIDLEKVNEEDNVDLDLAKWRAYENEYFNLKFKYHNNWYFQRDNLNAENYIAVYGFAPSSEELNNKDYAIQLFILNEDQNFTENFSFTKEKQEQNKKYILASNREEYQNILNLMFENLEFLDEEEISSLNTYTNEEYGFQFEYPNNIYLKKENRGYLLLRYLNGNETDWLISVNVENLIDFINGGMNFDEALDRSVQDKCSGNGPGSGISCPNILKKTQVGQNNIDTYEFYLSEQRYHYDAENGGNIMDGISERGPIFVFYINNLNNIFVFELAEYGRENNYEENVRILENIINTFKFTN